MALTVLSACAPTSTYGQMATRHAGEWQLTVPVDYANPDGPKIELAIIQLPALDKANRLGALVFAPGGPGDSALEYVTAHTEDLTRVRQRYDIVGMDPRGVGHSEPLRCLSDREMDEYVASTAPHAAAYKYVDGCLANSHGLLPHLGTENVARDLESLRRELGEEKLNYLGFSYGTRVGLSYAEQFPDRVGRMVLDSIDNPRSRPEIDLPEDDPTVDRIANEDDIVRIAGGTAALDSLLASLPVAASDGRMVTASIARAAMLQATLDGAKTFSTDPDRLQALADDYNDRNEDGTYNQGHDAYVAVNCLVGDPQAGVPDRAEVAARVDRVAAAAEAVNPYFGAWLTYREQLCEVWPVAPTFEPHDIHAPGAPPILLLNNDGDGITTLADAEAVDESLENSVLVVNKGTMHGTYLEGFDCVDTKVEAFLLEGLLPPEDTTCG